MQVLILFANIFNYAVSFMFASNKIIAWHGSAIYIDY